MKTVVVAPTYNERANVGDLVQGLHESMPEADVLIVDDSSPDGTSEEVQRLAAADPRLHLLKRDRALKGRGWAGRDGFVQALVMGAEVVVEMDADLSHQPRHVPALVAPVAAGEADVVLGSRYTPGGHDMDRPFHRRLTSGFARRYLRLVLGVPVDDPTSGFRAFSRKALETIDARSLEARDPFGVSEILFRCVRAGLRIREVPITFVDRTRGSSKLGLGTLVRYLARALALRLGRSPGP